MSADSIVSALGLSEMLAQDFLSVQLLILAATALLFALSIAMMILAARSAGGARKYRLEAETILRGAQDVMVEARQISAKIERAAISPSPGVSMSNRASAPIRVSARETTDEAEIEILDLKHADVIKSRDLDAARESATVPRGLLRRRR